MERDRIFHEGENIPRAEAAGASQPASPDYRQESAGSDAELKGSLDRIADMYRSSDVVNQGAQ